MGAVTDQTADEVAIIQGIATTLVQEAQQEVDSMRQEGAAARDLAHTQLTLESLQEHLQTLCQSGHHRERSRALWMLLHALPVITQSRLLSRVRAMQGGEVQRRGRRLIVALGDRVFLHVTGEGHAKRVAGLEDAATFLMYGK